MADKRVNIVSGPSKFDLMLALFDGDSSHRRSVIFSFETGLGRIDRKFWIDGLTREDGSEENWLFSGRTTTFKKASRLGNKWIVEEGEVSAVEGFFSTKTRTGTFVYKE